MAVGEYHLSAMYAAEIPMVGLGQVAPRVVLIPSLGRLGLLDLAEGREIGFWVAELLIFGLFGVGRDGHWGRHCEKGHTERLPRAVGSTERE